MLNLTDRDLMFIKRDSLKLAVTLYTIGLRNKKKKVSDEVVLETAKFFEAYLTGQTV